MSTKRSDLNVEAFGTNSGWRLQPQGRTELKNQQLFETRASFHLPCLWWENKKKLVEKYTE